MPKDASALTREAVLPEPELPDAADLMARGRSLAAEVQVGPCPFLEHYGVCSEDDYKRRCMADGHVMLHAQVGYRDLDKTRRAWSTIHDRIAASGHRVDRYGICLDWSMGYPANARRDMPRGTGLILEGLEDFARLTAESPVAPHFGDFVIGTPAAVENTAAALMAGSTSIGNLGQYFTFRMPHWREDVDTTAATLTAMSLAAAQSVEVLIHSNLDDGFAALFCDLGCALGAALLEQYIVDDLIGGRIAHCYGHTYTDSTKRLAFQRALADVARSPGTMVYGNTTLYGEDPAANYASLSSYLLIDILGQRTRPTGHALNPVPITEAVRIPDIDEIVDAHLFANRLVERAESLSPLFDEHRAYAHARAIVGGGKLFRENVLSGLALAGIDIKNPFELLLSIRRIGAKRLEELYGPGEHDASAVRGRRALVASSTLTDLDDAATAIVAASDASWHDSIRTAKLTGCLASTDVHEYGKLLIESTLRNLDVEIIDAGVSCDPDVLAATAARTGADFVAISTYNGVALDYLERLREEMARLEVDVPVFIGGKLNQIPDGTNTQLPVDVSAELELRGAIACRRAEDMLERLATLVTNRDGEPKRS